MAKKNTPKRRQGAHIWQSEKDGLWYANIVARNGNVLCTTEGYERKSKALRGLAAIRRQIITATSARVNNGNVFEAFILL